MDQITVSRELLRQAIEALTHGCQPGCESGMTDSGGIYPWGEPVLIPCPSCTTLTALRAALEQPAAEPVAYIHIPKYSIDGKVRPVVSFDRYEDDYAAGIYSERIPLFTAPQAQEKP